MEEGFIENRAGELPFAGILADLLTANLTQRPEKRAVFENMRGAVAIELDRHRSGRDPCLCGGKTPDRGGDRRESGDRHPDDVRPGDGSQRAADRRRASLVFRRGGPAGPGPPVRREAQNFRDVRSPGAADAVDQDHVRHVKGKLKKPKRRPFPSETGVSSRDRRAESASRRERAVSAAPGIRACREKRVESCISSPPCG